MKQRRPDCTHRRGYGSHGDVLLLRTLVVMTPESVRFFPVETVIGE
jgi:hypothetical protein